ncbi:NADAR family protein [Brachyspira hyodysenteriae]|uniref:NADAR family protein n=1 Tax=Brachyspira hyodysenteriae TaxID=159 RepID=UPI0022CE052D|nr:NADAR family protein [Brachyspira hyodysenteriae]MDA0022653.1 NADAR family protein [Brachyspira hyodysenteriae]
MQNIMPPIWFVNSSSYNKVFINYFNKLSNDDKEEYKKLFEEPIIFKGFYGNNSINKDIFSNNKEQKYSLEKLRKDFNSGKKIDFLFFYGHTNDKKEVTKSSLSQWYIKDFRDNDLVFNCMEKYMMYNKALLFDDKDIANEILNNNQPKAIKELGRKVKNFNDELWDKMKYKIVFTGNYYKFSQKTDLRNFLISTKNKVLVEASPYDKVWGIKMKYDDENIENPFYWKGENLLGFALMEVRDEIKRVYKNYDLIDWSKFYNLIK